MARKKSKKAKKKAKKRAGGRKKRARKPAHDNGANLGFEEKLWAAADKLRGHMDAAEYKHVVLGLIFLKYISDAFQERHEKLKRTANADPEDRDAQGRPHEGLRAPVARQDAPGRDHRPRREDRPR